MGVVRRLRCMDTRVWTHMCMYMDTHVWTHMCMYMDTHVWTHVCMYINTHVWTHGAEPSCGPTRAWDRPSYGAAAKLGDGHLQTPHCRHWR